MRFLKLLKKENGYALVLVMLTFAVVAILGTAIVASSMGEIKQSVAMDKDMRAYYQARSAADATMSWIEKKVTELNSLAVILQGPHTASTAKILYDNYVTKVKEFEDIVPSAINEPRVGNVSSPGNTIISGVEEVVVSRDEEYIYVKAIANVNGITASAKVRLNQKVENSTYKIVTEIPATNNTEELFNDSVFTSNRIEIKGGSYSIIGDVHYALNKDIQHEEKITGVLGLRPARTFMEWKPPADIDTKPQPWPSDKTFNSSKNGHYTGISNSGGGTYTINTTGPDDKVILHIDQLDVKGTTTINATGGGKVFLFIDALVEPSKKINLQILLDAQKPYVYLIFGKSVNEVSWNGNETVKAFIYAPTATVDFGGNPDNEGAIICNDFTANGNFKLTHRASNLPEEDFNGGSSIPTDSTPKEEPYTRQGSIGLKGKQWIKG